MVAPAGTPDTIIAKLSAAITRIVAETAFRDRHLIQRGLEAAVGSPAQFAAFIKKDRAAAERVVKASGIEPQ
jgi:tripartite-type tricarboxylate transporter receptor subunit TctC